VDLKCVDLFMTVKAQESASGLKERTGKPPAFSMEEEFRGADAPGIREIIGGSRAPRQWGSGASTKPIPKSTPKK
jgi:hypothetical protein